MISYDLFNHSAISTLPTQDYHSLLLWYPLLLMHCLKTLTYVTSKKHTKPTELRNRVLIHHATPIDILTSDDFDTLEGLASFTAEESTLSRPQSLNPTLLREEGGAGGRFRFQVYERGTFSVKNGI